MPTTGTTGTTGLFSDDAVIRRLYREPVLLLGGGRALLMQLAHPRVAAGVAGHSHFRADPLARLRHTVDAVATVVFGTEAQAHAAAGRMAAVHRRVRGDGYRAEDPALMMWVHATLVDTALLVYGCFIVSLSAADAERYYRESAAVAELLGVPRRAQPPDLTAFRDYVRSMLGSFEVDDVGRELARAVLHPSLGWQREPVLALARQLTAGLLPPALRRQYGLGWDWPRATGLLVTTGAARLVLPRLPGPVRRAPGSLVA